MRTLRKRSARDGHANDIAEDMDQGWDKKL